MLRARYRILGLAVPLLILAGPNASTSARSDGTARVELPPFATLTVRKNVQVSTALPEGDHSELVVGAHPAVSGPLVVGTIVEEGSGRHDTVFYTSRDAGKTWAHTLGPFGEGVIARDPAIAFGLDSDVYATGFANIPERHGDTYVRRLDNFLFYSADGGSSWSRRGPVPAGIDRPFIAVDRSGGPRNGAVYVHGTVGVRGQEQPVREVLLFRSLDQGRSFLAPVLSQFALPANRIRSFMGNSVVTATGRLLIVIGVMVGDSSIAEGPPGLGRTEITVLSSDDGGALRRLSTIASSMRAVRPSTVASLPMLAIDESASTFRGRVYAVWTDEAEGLAKIVLAHSSDGGTSWSSRVLGEHDEDADPTRDCFHPQVAVNRNGVVGVSYYTRRQGQAPGVRHVRFAASLDGGDTFSAGKQVSDALFEPGAKSRWRLLTNSGEPPTMPSAGGVRGNLYVSSFAFVGGDTAGLASDADGVFHPVWVDSRTGIGQIWTARVSAEGPVQSAVPPDKTDVTARTLLILEQGRFDPETGRLECRASVRNASREALRGPLTLRLAQVRSDMGTIWAVLGGRRVNPNGMRITLPTPAVLEPDQATEPVDLTFSIPSRRSLEAAVAEQGRARFLDVEGRVLAER